MKKLLTILLLVSGVALLVRGQVVVEEVGTLHDAFNSAMASYHAFQFKKAVESIKPVIAKLEGWEQTGRLQASDELLLESALELRAVSEYNLGKLEASRADFEHLIKLRPEYPLTITQSPKIQKYFEEVRASLTGSVFLDVTPANSVVYVDGRSFGSTFPQKLPLLKGLHVIRVTHPGYDPAEKQVNVDVGESRQVTVKLVPNARTIYFFVKIQGTRLYIDGKEVGTADEAADSRPDWKNFLEGAGVDPKSYYGITAKYLPPGDHQVLLKRNCYAPRRFQLTVQLDKARNLPGFIKPLAQERKTVTLTVVSHPEGAAIQIDGQSYGATPAEIPDFCIGTHSVSLVKKDVGRYKGKLDIPNQDRYRLEEQLHPTLLWVGLTRDQDVSQGAQDDADAAIASAVPAMQRFSGEVSQEKNPLLPDTFFVQGVSASQVEKTVKDLCGKYAAQALVAGKISRAGSGKGYRIDLRLLVPGIPGHDDFSVQVAGSGDASKALAPLDKPDESCLTNLALGDIPGQSNPAIFRIAAATGGVRPGDLLKSVDGKPVKSAKQVLTLLSKPGFYQLTCERNGKTITSQFKPVWLPRLYPYEGPGFAAAPHVP
ncbi:MAG: PEGA domain-containing protein [Acidobacteriota bacterium]